MNIHTSEALPDNFFLKYGIAVFALSGLLVSFFGMSLISNPGKTPVFFFAMTANLYFALAIWIGVRKFGNFGLALLIAIIPCVLALVFKLPYLIPVLLTIYLFLGIRAGILKMAALNIRNIAFVSVIAVGYAVVILSAPQLADIFFSSKMLVGQYNTDSFFHIAIASMIEHFGRSSIGAYGLVPIQSYTFSQYFFAAIAYITGISVLDSYASMYSIVLIPLLLLALSGAAENIQRSRTSAEYFFRLFLIGLIFVGFLGYGPGSLSTRYAMWPSFFESESYTLSLIFLLVMLSMLSIKNFGKQFWGICICLILMCLTKATTAIIAYGIFTAHLLFFSSFSYKHRTFLGGGATLCVVFALRMTMPQASEVLQLNYFDFVKQHVLTPESDILQGDYLANYRFWLELLKFSGVHFFFSWACFAFVANSLCNRLGNRLLGVKALIYNSVALSAAFIAVVFMALPAGAVYYFTNVSMFVALPFIIVYSGLEFADVRLTFKLPKLRILAPLIFMCIGLIGAIAQAPALFRAVQNKAVQKPFTAASAKFESYLIQLTSIRNTPETKNMLVYIAKENIDFWQAPTTASCLAQTFVIVAVSERPAIFGLPDKARCKVAFYGFNSYPEDLFVSSARSRITHDELIKETRKLGFDGYIDVGQTTWKAFYVE